MNLVDYISYDISTYKLQPEETLKVEIKLSEKTDNFSSLWVELTYNGETVVRDFRSVDSNSIYNFELIPPFNVPNGIYELRIGFDELSDYIIVDEIQIGEKNKEKSPYEVNITNIVIPKIFKKDESAQISADISISDRIDFDTSIYLSIWKDDLLFDVIESKCEKINQNETIEFSATLENDIPEGEYFVRLGIHKIKSYLSELKSILVVGTDKERSKYHKPMSYGHYYVKTTGKEHFWYINQFGTMIWDGEAYIPFGGMFVSKYLREYDVNNPEKNRINFLQDKSDLDEIRAAGINDLYIGANIMLVTPTWAYKFFIDYLESQDWNYGIQGDTRKNRRASVCYPRGTCVSNQFKVEDIIKSGRVSLDINSNFARFFDYEKNALYVVVEDESGQVVQSGITAMSQNSDGKIVMYADVEIHNKKKHTVYFTPEIFQDLKNASNFWDEPEKTYEFIDTVFSRLETGDNLRFIVDLLNNESGIYNELEAGRFSDEKFNVAFSEWLKNKYKSLEHLNYSWKTVPLLTSFNEASELIPVYTSNKGNINSYSYFVSIKSGKCYRLDVKKGVAWNDYLDARDEMYLDFMNKASDTAKKYLNVPHLYKHVSVQRKYFINKRTIGGFDGLGSEAYESIDSIANKFITTASMNNQFTRTAWNIVTETNNHENMIQKYESNQWSYESKQDMFERYDAALNLGMKGIFDFLLADRSDLQGKIGIAYSWVQNKHVIEWAAEYKRKISNPEFKDKLIKKFYKPFYYYPANKNWWMKPNEREVVQLADDTVNFKRLKTKKGIHIISTEDLYINTDLIFISLNDGPYTRIFGPQVSDFIKEGHNEKRVCILGHRIDIGSIPEVDKYFTNELIALNDNVINSEIVQVLNPTPNSTILKKTQDGKPWAIKDGNLYIIATNHIKEAIDEFETLLYVDELGITDFS